MIDTTFEITRQVTDPDKIFSYVNTSLEYIHACKLRIEIDKLRLEMSMISSEEFNQCIHDSMEKITHESEIIQSYISSDGYKVKFRHLDQSGSEFPSDTLINNVQEKGILRPVQVEKELKEVFADIEKLIAKK
ncbi:MAG: hypothetical protein ACK40G_10280 [Cytophagaceae bacterium]